MHASRKYPDEHTLLDKCQIASDSEEDFEHTMHNKIMKSLYEKSHFGLAKPHDFVYEGMDLLTIIYYYVDIEPKPNKKKSTKTGPFVNRQPKNQPVPLADPPREEVADEMNSTQTTQVSQKSKNNGNDTKLKQKQQQQQPKQEENVGEMLDKIKDKKRKKRKRKKKRKNGDTRPNAGNFNLFIKFVIL